MAGEKICKKCSREIDVYNDLFTVCEGECACFFHAKCVNLSEDILHVLSGNVIWMCDSCLRQFQMMRDNIGSNCRNDFNGAQTIETEVKELKSTVADILQTLSKLVPDSSSNCITPHHSTPVSSLAISNGTDEHVMNSAMGIIEELLLRLMTSLCYYLISM